MILQIKVKLTAVGLSCARESIERNVSVGVDKSSGLEPAVRVQRVVAHGQAIVFAVTLTAITGQETLNNKYKFRLAMIILQRHVNSIDDLIICK